MPKARLYVITKYHNHKRVATEITHHPANSLDEAIDFLYSTVIDKHVTKVVIEEDDPR